MRRFFTGSNIIETLVNFIEGSENDSVRNEITQWINANQENKEFFNQFRQVWAEREDLSSLLKENKEKDWEKISFIFKDQKPILPKGKTIHMFSRGWQRVAALILLFFFTTIGYFIGHDSTQQPLINKHAEYNEVIVPTGEKSELALSDGSRIWINAGSKIRFPNQFNNNSRDIWLDGEAYFEVTHDKTKPFWVHTSDVDVKVYGTKFNLKAYKDEDIIEATLVEGLVSLETRNLLNNTKEEVFLKPNHKAIFFKKKPKTLANEITHEISGPLKPRKILISNPIKIESSISWRDGKLEFVEESFENIAVKLERRYGVEIRIENDQIKKIKYTGVLKNISIEQALHAIQLTADFHYVIDDNTVVITNNENVNDKSK
jgi:ferric-dicitrate binding protein FerR (iron transport regulator)